MVTEVDYYELLECERGADDGALKSAYRRLAMRWHPDKNPGDKAAEAKFKAVSEAYDVLKDPQKRAAYDRFGHAAFQQGGGGRAQDMGGFSDIFETVFSDFMGGGGGGRGRGRAQRGADIRYDLELTFEEAFTGREAEIAFDVAAPCKPCDGTGGKPGSRAATCGTCGGRGQVRMSQGLFLVERTCPTCHGAGRVIADPCDSCNGEGRVEQRKTLSVKVPPGVDDGTRIRLTGQGEAGPRGTQAGDLYVFIALKAHPLFKRDGNLLFAQVPLSMTTAALGGEIEVPGLDREHATIKVPAGTQSGRQFRVRGRGMPVLNGHGFGDLVVQVDVETPTKLTARQRELLEEFRCIDEGDADSCPKASGFWAKLKTVWDDIAP